MTLGEKLKTIADFTYRSAKQAFGAFGVDADPTLALMVISDVRSRFLEEAESNTRNALFSLEDRIEQDKNKKGKATEVPEDA